jgi:hypothetical protein
VGPFGCLRSALGGYDSLVVLPYGDIARCTCTAGKTRLSQPWCGEGIVVHGMGARRGGSAAIGAGGVLFEDCGAAGRAQFVQLRIGALFVGGDPGVVRKAAENGIYRAFAGIPVGSWSLGGLVYNSTKGGQVSVSCRLARKPIGRAGPARWAWPIPPPTARSSGPIPERTNHGRRPKSVPKVAQIGEFA